MDKGADAIPADDKRDDDKGSGRFMLKLSGEAFAGGGGLGVDPDVVHTIAREIAAVVRDGAQIAVVIGEATSSVVPSSSSAAWTGPGPTTWACSAPS